jgi:hypothetical protein
MQKTGTALSTALRPLDRRSRGGVTRQAEPRAVGDSCKDMPGSGLHVNLHLSCFHLFLEQGGPPVPQTIQHLSCSQGAFILAQTVESEGISIAKWVQGLAFIFIIG